MTINGIITIIYLYKDHILYYIPLFIEFNHPKLVDQHDFFQSPPSTRCEAKEVQPRGSRWKFVLLPLEAR